MYPDITCIEPEVAELAHKVLSTMFVDRVGVIAASFTVAVETGQYELHQKMINATVAIIEYHDELRNLIVDQLRSDRAKPQMSEKTFAAKSAEALARLEDSAPVFPPTTEAA